MIAPLFLVLTARFIKTLKGAAVCAALFGTYHAFAIPMLPGMESQALRAGIGGFVSAFIYYWILLKPLDGVAWYFVWLGGPAALFFLSLRMPAVPVQ